MVRHHPEGPARPRARYAVAALLACCTVTVTVAGCARPSPKPRARPPATTPAPTESPTAILPTYPTVPPYPTAPPGGTTASPGTRPPAPGTTVTVRSAPSVPVGYPGDAKIYAQDALLAWKHGATDRLGQLTTATVLTTFTGNGDLRQRDWAYRGQEVGAGSTYVMFDDAGGAVMTMRVVTGLLGRAHAIDEVRF